jgi:hypothetical protein
MYRVLAYACVLGAGVAARSAIQKTWEINSGRRVPDNPAEPDVRWREALLWGAAAGVAVGLARTVARGLLPGPLQDEANAERGADRRSPRRSASLFRSKS